MKEDKKKIKLSRRFWGMNPETRVVPSSKIYKKKDRKYDYKQDLNDYDEESENASED